MGHHECVRVIQRATLAALIVLAAVVPCLAQSRVEVRTSAPAGERPLELVTPSPGASEISKPREADFYGQDVPVQHEPGFIEPLTTRPREGRIRAIGVSGWTAPSGLAEGAQRSQISGWFAIGISMTWE
jgi:hypothetical protein